MNTDFSFHFNFSNARLQAHAWIHGMPRERKSRPLQFTKEVQKKRRVVRIEASMGIVGLPGSGRKCLAYRLANMNRGVLREIPIALSYTINYSGRFVDSNDFGYSRYYLRIIVFVIPEPKLPPRRTRADDFRYSGPPLFQRHWNNFSCLVMAYDVMSLITFHYMSLMLSALRRRNVRIPTVFVVGNKCDQRFGRPPNDTERFVSERTANMEASNLGGTYFEVSAQYNTGVAFLLSKILECVVQRTRNWHLD